jgi:type IV pilus assembly protein PilP
MMQKMTIAGARWLIAVGLIVALAGCGSDQSELQTYIDRIKARPGRGIEPLPEFRPAPSYVYQPHDRRSPFVPDLPQLNAAGTGGVNAPDADRPLEFLEQMPLDALTMVGTLRNKQGSYGLVQDSDSLVHRVAIGNHMGQNYGRITNITDSEIQLIETVGDGLGGYMERPARIGLSD